MPLEPGDYLGSYRIAEPLGQGSMARVFRAYQPSLDRTVAIKVIGSHLAQNPSFQARFRREAAVLARLEHPNILPVFDYGEQDGLAFIVYRYVAGGTLADRLGKPLTAGDTLRLLSPVAAALDFAHTHGVVHRDVKPVNILLTEDQTPIVADFGLASLLQDPNAAAGAGLTGASIAVGTPAYMPPEQVQALRVDGRADEYALATVTYQMLTGAVPFAAETPLAVALLQVQGEVPSPRERCPDVGPAVAEVLLRGLAKAPEERYATCAAFVAALAAAAAADGPAPREAVTAAPERTGASAQRRLIAGTTPAAAADAQTLVLPRTSRGRQPALVAAALLSAVLLAGAGLLAVGKLRGGGRPGERAAAQPITTPAPVVAAAGVLPATPEASATSARPTPTPTASDILYDDFADADQGLLPRAAANPPNLPAISVAYQQGEYVIKETGVVQGRGASFPVGGESGDVALAFDARLVGDTGNRMIVVICGAGYQFRVDPGAGVFSLIQRSGSEKEAVKPIVDWQPSAVIRRGTFPNRIAVRCANGTISGAINGVEVASAPMTSAYSGVSLGVGTPLDTPVDIEMRVQNLVLARGGAAIRPAPGGGASGPAGATWAAGLAMPRPPVGRADVSEMRVYDNSFSRHEHRFIAGDYLLTCFTLKPGSDAAPLVIVATDAGDAPPASAAAATVVARSAPVPPLASGKCYRVDAVQPLKPLHTYRVSVLSGSTVLASRTFLNEPKPEQIAFADDFSDPAAGLLAGRPTTNARIPGFERGYDQGEYFIRFAQPLPINDQGIPITVVFSSASDGAMAIDARTVGAGTGGAGTGGVLVGCRENTSGAYLLFIGASGYIFLYRTDRVDTLRNVQLITPHWSAAVALGTATNHIVLRCVGHTISAAVNGVEVASAEDDTYSVGTFFFAVDGNGGPIEARFGHLVIVREQ